MKSTNVHPLNEIKINKKCSILEKAYGGKSSIPTLKWKGILDSPISIDNMAYKELELSNQYHNKIPLLKMIKLSDEKGGLSEYEDNETG